MLLIHAGAVTALQEGDCCTFDWNAMRITRGSDTVLFSSNGIIGGKSVNLPSALDVPQKRSLMSLLAVTTNLPFKSQNLSSFFMGGEGRPPLGFLDGGRRVVLESGDHLMIDSFRWELSFYRASQTLGIWDGRRLHPRIQLPFSLGTPMSHTYVYLFSGLMGASRKLVAAELAQAETGIFQFLFSPAPSRTPAGGFRASR